MQSRLHFAASKMLYYYVRIVYVAEWARKKILYLYVTPATLQCTNTVTE